MSQLSNVASHPLAKNILAVVVGIIFGSAINSALIHIGPSIIPHPDGADVSSMDALAASMPLFEPKHFLFPFLAHSLGTLSGAFVAALIASSHHFRFAMGIGGFFMLGGIAAVAMIPAPMWFNIIDLVFAYIPMAWIAGAYVESRKSPSAS